MRKKIFGIIAVVLFVTISYFVYPRIKEITTPKKVHYHAGFVVFQDNKKLDFSDFRYMYTKPCVLDKKQNDEDIDTQMEKAHLHDQVGDVVHIERSGAVWNDLFTNMKFAIDYNKVVGFINGKKTANFEFQAIRPDDTLAVFIGSNDIAKDLQMVPAKDYIEKIAKKSTTCGD